METYQSGPWLFSRRPCHFGLTFPVSLLQGQVDSLVGFDEEQLQPQLCIGIAYRPSTFPVSLLSGTPYSKDTRNGSSITLKNCGPQADFGTNCVPTYKNRSRSTNQDPRPPGPNSQPIERELTPPRSVSQLSGYHQPSDRG